MTRFPKFPPDILARADALLASKYGTSEPIDPALAILVCDAMMVEQERCAGVADVFAAKLNSTAERLNNPPSADRGWQQTAQLHEQGAIVAEDIAKAIRGTE
jgi:hypothetical protein